LNITYTVDNNDFYSVNVNETGIEFSDPNDYYTLSPYEITTWNSASDAVANNSATWDGVTAKQDASAMSAYQLTADMSAYIPTSESANYQQASEMTAYQETSGMSAYQLTADMTAYQPSGDYIYASALGTGVI
jgi:hypothetical protein